MAGLPKLGRPLKFKRDAVARALASKAKPADPERETPGSSSAPDGEDRFERDGKARYIFEW